MLDFTCGDVLVSCFPVNQETYCSGVIQKFTLAMFNELPPTLAFSVNIDKQRNITHLMGQSKPTVHLHVCGVRSIVTKLELAWGLFWENTCIGQVKKGWDHYLSNTDRASYMQLISKVLFFMLSHCCFQVCTELVYVLCLDEEMFCFYVVIILWHDSFNSLFFISLE